MTTVLDIRNIRKNFRSGFIPKTKNILKGISLSVEKGEIFGYLGPNGAGKTTTIKSILGLIFPDSGRIEIFGRDHLDPSSREKIGFMPESPYFYDYLTGLEFLDFYGQLFNIRTQQRTDKIKFLLNRVGLEKAADLPLRKFSRGMLQRIGLAQALINDPSLVLLDEPLGGLDPLGRKEIRDIISGLREEGKTVFLSSHILQDIEMICDRVAIIIDGRIVSSGRLSDLISEEIIFTEMVVSGIEAKELVNLGTLVSSTGEKILLKVPEEDNINQIIDLVRTRKGKIHSMIPRTQTLEDIFVDMVKNR